MIKPIYTNILMFLALVVTSNWASSNQIAILFNGNTPVNMDAIHFLETQFEANQTGWSIVPVQTIPQVINGNFRAVVVLNTGVKNGIDRKLAESLKGIKDKSRFILLTLRAESNSIEVSSFPPSAATLQIDGIAAASTWKGKGFVAIFGGKPTPEYTMHLEWSKRVIALIRSKTNS